MIRLGRVFVASLVVGVLLQCAEAFAQAHCTSAEATTTFGVWASPGLAIAPGLSEPYEPKGVVAGKVGALRFQVELKESTARRWTLTVRDMDLRVLATMGKTDFIDGKNGQPLRRLWTGMLSRGAVYFDLDVEGGQVDVRVDSVLVYPERVEGVPQYSVKTTANPDWSDLYPPDAGSAKPLLAARRVGDTVGMLASAVEKDGIKNSWCCSGVLLSSTILLTNWHCGGTSVLSEDSVWKGDVCPNSVVDLGWDQSNERRQYGCKSVILKNRPLDFVLLRLSTTVGAGAATGEARPVRYNVNELIDNQDVFMVHHALCKQKLVSSKCRVLSSSYKAWRPSHGRSGDLASSGEPMSDFTHNCDTEPGASGAAVFNMNGELIGLHHLGFELGTDNKCDGRNKAVKIKEILKVIKRDAPSDIVREIGIPDNL